MEDSIFLRCHFYPYWYRDSTKSPTLFDQTSFLKWQAGSKISMEYSEQSWKKRKEEVEKEGGGEGS